MSLPAILLLTLAFVFIVLIACFIYSLVWGKPWSINLLYMRTFLRFALKAHRAGFGGCDQPGHCAAECRRCLDHL